jgi:hypothetical protein
MSRTPKHGLGPRLGRFYTQLKFRARTKGQALNLTWQEYQNAVESKHCYYCNGPLPRTGHGLDRMDNTLGYSADNVVACCGNCNFRKGKLESAGFKWPRIRDLMFELLAE